MWEKFTPSALSIIKSATREAKLSGYPEVNTSHLLFSLVRQRTEGVRASQVLRDFNLSPEVVYDELIAVKAESPTDRKLPLAPEAETVLRLALEEANRAQFPKIGGDELLIGLLNARESTASRFLYDRGVTREDAQVKLVELALLEQIDYALGRDQEDYTPLVKACSPKLRRAFFQAVKLTLAEGSPDFGPEHLLRGVLLSESNELTQLLQELDYPTDRLRRQLEEAKPSFVTPETTPVMPQPTSALRECIVQMHRERELLSDPLLNTVHLLLALLSQTQSTLHERIQSLGDVNVLNHRRMVERLRHQREMRAE